jgi:hypothetical protein
MKKIKLFILLTLIVSGVFLYKYHTKPKSCNTVVILDSGEKIKCKWLNSYASGFTSIHRCNNTDFLVETDNIKQVINSK